MSHKPHNNPRRTPRGTAAEARALAWIAERQNAAIMALRLATSRRGATPAEVQRNVERLS